MFQHFGMLSLVLAGIFCCGGIMAAEGKETKDTKKSEEKEDKASKKKVTYAVVQVDEEFMVMPSEDAAKMEKDAAKAAKDAKSAKDAKDSKDKSKKVAKKATHKAMVVKILKDKFATKAEAEKFRDELVAKEEKKKEKEQKAKKTTEKTAKETPKK